MKQILCTLFVATSGLLSYGQITDGGFEAGNGAGTWTESSVNFGTPICDATCGTCGGFCFPKSGSFYAWFGGSDGFSETASVQQVTTIPAGTTATINMEVKMPTPGPGIASDRLEISVDGNVVGTITALDSASFYNTYALASYDISVFADGGNHTVRIEGFQTTTTVFNVLVDNVTLTVDSVLLSLMDFEKPAVSVYPNPAQDFVNIEFSQINKPIRCVIIDITGKEVISQEFNATDGSIQQLNVQGLAEGVYTIRILGQDKNLLNKKLVITE